MRKLSVVIAAGDEQETVEALSKLEFWPNGRSYLALLRRRFDRWSVAALLLLLAGLAVRLAAAYPVHKYPADADCMFTGLCAFKVLRGETPVFSSGYRIGSLECHVAAALFALFGGARASLAAVPVVIGGALLAVTHRFAGVLLGRRLACLALLFLALPSPAVLFWTYMPNGYPMILLLCATALWLAARLERGQAGAAGTFGLGLIAGLGVWHSFLTFACLAPALLWLLARRRNLLRRGRFWLLAGGGLLLGAAPWIAFNTRYPLESFRHNFASRPARGIAAVVANAEYFATSNLPELVASTDPEGGIVPAGPVERALRVPVLAVHALAALFFLAWPALRGWRRERAGVTPAAWTLLVGVAAAVFALNAFSEAGQVRGLTMRYVLPLYLLVAPVLALFLAAVSRRSRVAAVTLGLAIVTFNLAGYRWPWEERRTQLQRLAAADSRLTAELIERQAEVAVGGFWTVYPLAFLSGERVLAVPCERDPSADPYAQAQKLPATVHTWALVSGASSRDQLAAWAGRTGSAGALTTVDATYAVFLPRRSPLPKQVFLDRVVAACGPPPPGP